MAAGGSLVHTAVPGLLFTPLCPFSLSFRPLILPQDVRLTFRPADNSRAGAMVSVDGHTRFELDRGERLDVNVSKSPALCKTSRPSGRCGSHSFRERLGLVCKAADNAELVFEAADEAYGQRHRHLQPLIPPN
jgi:NAD kinase